MTTHNAATATGLPSALFDRRRMLLGLAAASTAAAAPIAQAAAASSLPLLPKAAAAEPADLSEATALFRDLNPGRRARMLATLRDCLAAQRIVERIETGALS